MVLPLIITVILNTNRREDTLAALESLGKSTCQRHREIVLDNASTDGSVQAIHAMFPGVQVISLTENLGYAGNNNVGIRTAVEQGADWVFVLNEDTIVDPECLSCLVEVGEGDPKIGIVGPMVYHFDEPGVIQSAGGVLDRMWNSIHAGQNQDDRGQFPGPRQVDWISGCAILVRRAVIQEIGGLDESFFYYWEETEWCVRARENGWRIVHVPAAKIWHKGVQRNYQPSPNVTYYATRNRFLLLSRHRAPFIVWIYAILRTARILASWTLKPRYRAMRQHRDAMWQGSLDFIRRRWGIRLV